MTDTKLGYEPPTITVLGSVAEITLTGTGAKPDKVNTNT
ncbi:MAG TPA: lasso RiPP family leader peptide-containing protein [Actinomycetota bacterium]|nr:lasso RiPP family leader peptide-containing protein [Actinomycetota bacterium]